MVKRAFTLAEVLITLTVVGIVAALTIPDVISKIEADKQLTAMRKTYSMLQQVTNLVVSEYGNPEYWGMYDDNIDSITNTYIKYRKYFKIMRECKNQKGCWAYPTKYLNGEVYWGAQKPEWFQYAFTGMDGINFLMDIYPAGTIRSSFGVDTDIDGVVFWVDMNADKNPNVIGEDIFAYVVTRYGLIPAGFNNMSTCKRSGTGWGCTARVIRDGYQKKY